MSNLKDKLNPKVIVYAVIGVFALILLLSILSSGDTTGASQDHRSGKVIIKNEKPHSREFFESYRTGKDRASLSSRHERKEEISKEEKNLDISDRTDDPDALLLQSVLREDKEQPEGNKIIPIRQQIYEQQPTRPVVQIVEKSAEVEDVKEAEEKKASVVEPETRKNAFYGVRKKETQGNTISCTVHGHQEMFTGSTLKLRLMEDFTTVEGNRIEKGTTLYGECKLSAERVFVNITSILVGKDLIGVNLEVFDMDGLKGVNLPNDVKAEIAKRLKSQSIQEIPTDQVADNNNIIGKGVSAVASVAKNLVARKTEEPPIPIKSNYRLLLKSVKE